MKCICTNQNDDREIQGCESEVNRGSSASEELNNRPTCDMASKAKSEPDSLPCGRSTGRDGGVGRREESSDEYELDLEREEETELRELLDDFLDREASYGCVFSRTKVGVDFGTRLGSWAPLHLDGACTGGMLTL